MGKCEPKAYKCTDGNGGHIWDWAKIKESVIAGIILASIISVATVALNRVFNVQHLESAMARVEKYQLRSLQMNELQNKQINDNTVIIYEKFYRGVPPPRLIWPSDEVK